MGKSSDLDDLRQAGAVADRQGVLAPDPIEAFLGHAEGDDDIYVITVVLLSGVFQGSGNLIPFAGVVVYEVGDLEDRAVSGFYELKSGLGIGALPFPQFLKDVLHLADLVLCALAGVDVGNVQNGFLFGVQHLHDFVGVAASVEVVADVELLEVLVAVELFVIGVGDGVESSLVFWVQHGLGITAKVGTGHGYDVGFVTDHELTHVIAQLIVWVGGNVVKLIHGDQAIVEGFYAKLVYGEAEGGVGTDQHLGLTCQKLLHCVYFAAVVPAWCVAKVPLGFDLPIGPKAKLA